MKAFVDVLLHTAITTRARLVAQTTRRKSQAWVAGVHH